MLSRRKAALHEISRNWSRRRSNPPSQGGGVQSPANQQPESSFLPHAEDHFRKYDLPGQSPIDLEVRCPGVAGEGVPEASRAGNADPQGPWQASKNRSQTSDASSQRQYDEDGCNPDSRERYIWEEGEEVLLEVIQLLCSTEQHQDNEQSQGNEQRQLNEQLQVNEQRTLKPDGLDVSLRCTSLRTPETRADEHPGPLICTNDVEDGMPSNAHAVSEEEAGALTSQHWGKSEDITNKEASPQVWKLSSRACHDLDIADQSECQVENQGSESLSFDDADKSAGKLDRCGSKITSFFSSKPTDRTFKKLRGLASSAPQQPQQKNPNPRGSRARIQPKKRLRNNEKTKLAGKQGGMAEWAPEAQIDGVAQTNAPTLASASLGCPWWEHIAGTCFRVDGFKHQTSECSHWFLTHFHSDHYAGLTKSFRHGVIYCSSITARLLKLKIGLADEKLKVLELNKREDVAGVGVTFLDANHCPGAVMILFEPPNGEVVLHTGDFRWSPSFLHVPAFKANPIHTLILDTTYCNPKFQLPTQEVAIQFAVDAVLAEAFNPNTLYLVGTYGIGKERLLFEVARALKRKVYVGTAKKKLLECMDLTEEDLRLLTTDDGITNLHAVPLWSISSFQRMQRICHMYQAMYTTIVALSPTGWAMGQQKKGFKKGRRMQRGMLVRYEIPYSEHCSFDELQMFVRLVKPQKIVPSVGNNGEESANTMVALLCKGTANGCA